MPRHLAIVGATASGKSAVALEIARRSPEFEIVSADSMQVYRGMDIGTAKATVAERAEVPHHLIDVVDPSEDWSVSRFQAAVREVMAGIEARGRRALLVGGTGLYVRAVVDDLHMPGEYPQVRAELESDPDTAALHARLASLDPAAASRVLPGNRRRIVRALEVTLGSGRLFSAHGPGLGVHPPSAFAQVGVWLPRAVVAARIAGRYAEQLAAGFVEEVRGLATRGTPLSRTARQALGYREVLEYLDGGSSLGDAIVTAERRTREFARRQRVWFRRDPRVTWIGAATNPIAAADAVLGDLSRWATRSR